jgi:transcription-repair coupling factor (superfamily II helicase)
MYRQVSRAATPGQVREAQRAMRDRFGPLPQEAQNLLSEAEIRILADRAGIDSIHVEDGRLHFGVRDAEALAAAFKEEEMAPRMVADDLAVLDAHFAEDDPEGLAHFLKGFLSRGG